MLRIILLVLAISGSALSAAAADSCRECHGDRQKMDALGYGGFAVTAREAEAQTRMPARCDQCHLGHPDTEDRSAAHQGMARLLVVSRKRLTPMTSVRLYPLQYGTNPVSR